MCVCALNNVENPVCINIWDVYGVYLKKKKKKNILFTCVKDKSHKGHIHDDDDDDDKNDDDESHTSKNVIGTLNFCIIIGFQIGGKNKIHLTCEFEWID